MSYVALGRYVKFILSLTLATLYTSVYPPHLALRLPVTADIFLWFMKKKKVEKMIGDLGQMFSRFSTMVAAQEEVVMHIEDDVEAAHAFAEEGQAHLAK